MNELDKYKEKMGAIFGNNEACVRPDSHLGVMYNESCSDRGYVFVSESEAVGYAIKDQQYVYARGGNGLNGSGGDGKISSKPLQLSSEWRFVWHNLEVCVDPNSKIS